MLFKHGSGTAQPVTAALPRALAAGCRRRPVLMRGFRGVADVIARPVPAAKVVARTRPTRTSRTSSGQAEEVRQRGAGAASFAAAVPGRQVGTSHAVRLSDELMQAVIDDGWWNTVGDHRRDGERLRAATWCDRSRRQLDPRRPVVQYESTINAWNPCPGWTHRCLNPFGEYLFLDDTACSLASLNPAFPAPRPRHTDVAARGR
jgi:hypothetical protein